MLIPGVYIKGNDLAGILNGKIKALLETSMINWSALLVLYHDKVKPLLVTSEVISLKLRGLLRGYQDATLGLETNPASWDVILHVLMDPSHHCHHCVPQECCLPSSHPYETAGVPNVGCSRNHNIA